ncbi:MAG: hypothetical protein HZY73_11140 [Micropruina sp.]|nr:MAG: hypothetical protein HZY73_11140 [Micropruina sp.]
MSDQTITVTIPASGVRKGDRIDIGGIAHEVLATLAHDATSAIYVGIDGEQWGSLYLPSDAKLTVASPDPDAELVETVAEALCLGNFGRSLDDDETAAACRSEARLVIAALREKGALK